VSGKKGCTSIVLNGIKVPAGQTLDMTDLSDGTTVTFEGTTTFGYEEWDGPLVSFSGSNIIIQGASGHLIDMGGEQWWDGEGSNGGKTVSKKHDRWQPDMILIVDAIETQGLLCS
jgi:polygalacturonase